MFNFATWPQWAWVALAWGQLTVFYLGYLLYLRWRAKRLAAELAKEER